MMNIFEEYEECNNALNSLKNKQKSLQSNIADIPEIQQLNEVESRIKELTDKSALLKSKSIGLLRDKFNNNLRWMQMGQWQLSFHREWGGEKQHNLKYINNLEELNKIFKADLRCLSNKHFNVCGKYVTFNISFDDFIIVFPNMDVVSFVKNYNLKVKPVGILKEIVELCKI